jgi:DNA-binding NtrC family response regulator
MAESEVLDIESLPLPGNTEVAMVPASHNGEEMPMSLDMDEIETWAIRRALRQTGGNVSHAARLLGMSRDTLHTKLKKKGIDREAIANAPDPVGVE